MSYITSGRDPRAGMRGGVSGYHTDGYHTDGVGASPFGADAFSFNPAAAASQQALIDAEKAKAKPAAKETAAFNKRSILPAKVAKPRPKGANTFTDGGGNPIVPPSEVESTGPSPLIIGGLAVAALGLFFLAKKAG